MDTTIKTPTPPLESLRVGDQELRTHHIERASGTNNKPHNRQLPRGISETEEERTKHWFIGSIDQGTTSSRFLIFNGEGNPIASHQIEFENMYPEPG
jgi:glycerol kinase